MTRRIGLRRPSHLRLAFVAFAAAFGLGALTAKPASAQGWLKDRRYAEGAGIKAGDFELHPGIGGEVGYDSNWFLRSNDEGPGVVNAAPAAPRRDAAVFRVTPSFSFSTLGPQRTEGSEGTPPQQRMIVFRGSLAATLWGFVGKEMSDQHNVSGDANLRLDIAPQRPVGFGIWGGYRRMIRPNAASADAALGFNQSQFNGGAEAIFQPGGGTFDMRGGYQIYANLFEQTNGVPFSSLTHEFALRNRWLFRPRTALFSDTTLRLTSFPESDRAFSYLANQTPIRSRFGLNGLLTARLGALASAGYGATFLQDPGAAQTKQFDSLLAQAELTYYFGVPDTGGGGEPGQVSVLLSSWSLGYNRDFQQSFFTNWYRSDRIYTRGVVAGAGRMLVTLDGGFEFLTYPDVFANAGGGAPSATPTTPAFANHRISGTLFAEYRLSDSFGLNATFDYQQMLSDTRLPLGGGQAFGLSWQRFQALAGARWFL